ncbi:2TM domain-containing protein [Cryptosporangium sp. NPDC051539]|uniref:2TM domain-containing protein n=1 Tax=Cryptosporangium sp. NPDC051539 TaxID=3363962 RepID=UPI0037B4D954
MTSDPLRAEAVRRVHRKRGLQIHALWFVLVTLALIVVWLIWLRTIFFWPLTGLAPWAVGLAFHAWAVYHPSDGEDRRVEREMDRLRSRRPSLD